MSELANLIAEVAADYSPYQIVEHLRRNYFPHLSEEVREIDEQLISLIFPEIGKEG